MAKTTEQFIVDAMDKHGTKYDYSKVEYTKAHSHVLIICPSHGEFHQVASDHLKGRGCRICGRQNTTSNTKEFIAKARAIHGDRYDYSQVDYTSALKNVLITCKEHGGYDRRPNDHLNGIGCPVCSSTLKTTDTFTQQAKLVHGDKYDYSLVNYINNATHIDIICSTHGTFKQVPYSHLNGNGCRNCNTGGSSNIAIDWLTYLSDSQNINIQHACNGGEYRIPGTRYKVDGYCLETNTVYEFYGDYWHGNPNVYSADAINENNKTAMGELYKQTITREQKIIELGYNIVKIWESEWISSPKLLLAN